MVNTYIQLEDGQILNLSKDVIVPLNKGLNDIKDLSKRKGGYSKTIIVDGTKHNNNVLGHLYDVNIQASSFNPKAKVRCKLYQNNTQVFEGYIRLLKINRNNNSQFTTEEVVRYEMNIYDDTADFFNSIEGNLNNMDLSFLNHTWNADEVINSQSYNYNNGYKYLFPRAFSDWNENTVEIGSNITNIVDINYNGLASATTWQYGIRVRGPISNLSPGETITMDSINSPWAMFNDTFNIVTAIYNSVTDLTTITVIVPSNFGPTDSYDGIGVLTFNGDDTNVKFDFAGIWEMHQFYPSFYARLYWDIIFTSAGYTYQFDLLDSDLIKFNRLIIPSPIAGKIEKEDGWIAPYNNTGTDNTPFDNVEPIEQVGSTINLGLNAKGENPFLPNMSRKDFLQSIMTMFNLYLIPDENDPKKLIVKRRDDFYAEGENKDWTQKLDTSKTITIEDNPDLGSSELVYTYTQGKEIDVVEYENVTGDISGKQTVKFSDKNLKGESKVEVKFNPFMNDRFVLGAKDPFLINIPYFPVSFEPYRSGDTCIVYDGVRTSEFTGLINQLPCFILNCNLEEGGQYNVSKVGGKEITNDTYQVVSHLDSWDNPLLDLNFGTNRFYALPINPFINVDNFTQNNLFNLHHRRTVNQLDKAKLMTAYFNLNEVDFKEVKLNDRIWVRDRWWNIYNIKDYNANERRTTKVELLSIDEDSRINSFDTIQLPIKTTKSNYLDGKINTYIGRVKDRKYTQISTNELLEPNIILGGSNDVQGRRVIVLGKNNTVEPGVENTMVIGNEQSVSQSNSIVIQNAVITDTITELATEVTRAELLALQSSNDLAEGNTYFITDRDIWVKALSNNTFSPSAIGAKTSASNTYYIVSGINKGVFNANDPVDVVLGDIYVWGSKVWEVTTAGLGVVPINNETLPSANFTQIPLDNDTYYTTGLLAIQYDVVSDRVTEIRDNRANVYRTFTNTQNLWNDIIDYWDVSIYSNQCGAIYNNSNASSINGNINFIAIFNNSNAGSISRNSNTDSGVIFNNTNDGFIRSNTNSGDISGNSNDGFIRSNTNSGDISSNSNDGNISNNSNDGDIFGNSNNGNINGNSNVGFIFNNSNNGNIQSNTNIGNIAINSNNGNIFGNSNKGAISNNSNLSISNNSNLGSISNNSNNSSIILNTNIGNILNNSNDGAISGNINNGDIFGNSNNGNISFNSNNGNISNNTPPTTDISDPIVNK